MEQLQTLIQSKKKVQINLKYDLFGNQIELGDVVLWCCHSTFAVGKIVSLPENGINVTCLIKERPRWNNPKAIYRSVQKFSPHRVPTAFAKEYITEALNEHNAIRYIRFYGDKHSDGGVIYQTVINLTKLNIHTDENP